MAAGFVCGIGWALATASGVAGREAARALAVAWVVQAAAFAVLARGLGGGRDVTRTWAGGIAARAGALFLAWPATRAGLISREAAAVFGLGLAALIILEAIWLATIPPHPGSNDR